MLDNVIGISERVATERAIPTFPSGRDATTFRKNGIQNKSATIYTIYYDNVCQTTNENEPADRPKIQDWGGHETSSRRSRT